MFGAIIVLGFLFFTWAVIDRFLTFRERKRENMKIKSLVLFAALPLLSACGFEVVNEGFRGIETNWGKVVGEPLPPGLHFYNPISSGIFEMDVREHKVESQTACFTRDTQGVQVAYAVTLFPEPLHIGKIYGQFGLEWEEKLIRPAVESSIKDMIGQYIADELVSKREAVTKAAFEEIRRALESRHLTATRLDITNLDFNDDYERAVEAKVVAVQRAAEAKNKTVQVREEAEQKIVAAKADAESMRIKSQALSQNKGLVNYEAVQKWDGRLPVNMYGSAPVPFLNLKGE